MTGQHGRVRARDADRDRVVDVLGQAYVDGQLSESDRELRVSRALSARTLDDLDLLVRDLQDHDVVVRRPERGAKAPAVAVAAGLAVLVAIGFGLLRGGDGNESASDPVAAPPPVEQIEAPEVAEPVQVTPAALSRAWFKAFLAEYKAEFGDMMILDAGFRQAGFVHFKRPINAERPDVLQDWEWTPERGFEQSNVPAAHDQFDLAAADLGRINLRRLLAEIEHSRHYLGVENPDMDVFLSPHTGESPQLIEITAGNSYGDTGRRYLTLEGQMVESLPFVIGR